PQSIEEAFPAGSNVFYLGRNYFGFPCRVARHTGDTLTITKMYYIYPDKVRKAVAEETHQRDGYVRGNALAHQLNVTANRLSQLTSCLLVEDRDTGVRMNIGLHLKSHAKRLKMLDYVRLNRREWEYSPKACQAITEYFVS
ncbi:hypothetical protein SYNPS1DRAFT_14519, partial [Syncephalis pseudoplumigaleata]